ncbi:J domain-containing protein [Spirosoma endophyticum]|uniref:J domain-containing protein n=1 Tax=Spirosoma endophyticum TaxID=662367 RepID=A0A1I1WA73_9BACT|nr:J domain-containing protein [Spirosoma endophyticum]SFD92057.1 hypothetical protein SAMN05216167_108199 [Spirosoma endophyticum]
MLGGSQIIISSYAVLRNDGLPRSFQLRTDATGVAVYFLYEGKQVVIAYDKWFNISDNIRAIGLTIDAMRGIDRWGVSQMLKRTFAGFKALPKTATEPGWWTITGVMLTASWETIRAAYKEKVKVHHPDKGGSAQAFAILQSAYETAKSKCVVRRIISMLAL